MAIQTREAPQFELATPAILPAAAPMRPPTAYVRLDDGSWQEISHLQLQPGAGPSRAPPCPDPNNHVWLQNSWREVLQRRPYAAVAAAAAAAAAETCIGNGESSRSRAAAPSQPPAASPAHAPLASPSGNAAMTPLQVGPGTATTAATGSGDQQHRHSRRAITKGYQVLVWGPRRDKTTILQVQLAARDLLASMGQGLPSVVRWDVGGTVLYHVRPFCHCSGATDCGKSCCAEVLRQTAHELACCVPL